MAAGGVCAPVVIPLREFTPGSRATKNVVDEKTPIELFSDSKDAVVYYTINGEKPEPFQKFGKKSTFKYLKPFSLPVGKRTVRTIAVNSHGQTSSAVTKVFLVNPCKDEEPPPSPPASDTISLGDDSLTVASLPEVSLDEDTAPPHSGTQILRSASRDNQRICLQCKHPLPNVEDARFCPRCGFSHPSLTDVREPVTPTNFAYCQRCRAVVPKKMSCCPSCHSPMGKLGRLGTIVAQKDLVVEDGVTCDYCGTTNPPDCHMCVTCERNLTPLLNHSPNRNTYPLVAFGSEEYHSMCSACGRVNSRDARYCDWCGSHVGLPLYIRTVGTRYKEISYCEFLDIVNEFMWPSYNVLP
jgi:RNA polymerase subunit RPABC4/transcription elongation factor Spt4